MAEILNAANAAAKWWRGKIENLTPSNFDNGGGDTDTTLYCMFVSYSFASKNTASIEQLENFQTILTELINKELEKNSKIVLSCNYGPSGILIEAANKAEINRALFPFKRTMKITKDLVTIKDGYRKKYKKIYPVNTD